MRIVHISDVHLGYRAYSRINNSGVNVREADVFKAFRESLTKVADLQPDIVIIAGDLFHVVRPSNLMIEFAFKQFLQLREHIKAPVIIIGGNHETPRSLETGCILELFRNIPGFHIVHSNEETLRFPELNTSVLCLCHRAVGYLESISLETDPASKYNIMVVHGTVEGVLKQAYDSQEISREYILSDAWDYIAFGHYHCYTKLAENAYYSGSLEYTSTNIWSETSVPKGFVEYDLDSRQVVAFQEVKTRNIVDVRAIDAAEMSAQQVMKAIENRLQGVEGGYADKVIRLVIENIPRAVQKDLDFGYIRSIRTEALHFDLQLRRPGDKKIEQGNTGDAQIKTIENEWVEYSSSLEFPAGVKKDVLTDMGIEYLQAEVPVETL